MTRIRPSDLRTFNIDMCHALPAYCCFRNIMDTGHEDETQTREEGFMRGAWFLEQFC